MTNTSSVIATALSSKATEHLEPFMSFQISDIDTTLLLTFAILGYLLGSIPFGLVLTRLAGLGDIRKIGSGNIGATNVLRTGHWGLALLTVILDTSKAAIAALVPAIMFNYISCHGNSVCYANFILASLIAGTCAILGHNFPIWLKFKGGKGVASTFGFILVTAPAVGGLAFLTWIVVAFITRYSSLSAITAAVLVPVYAYFLTTPVHTIFYTAIAVLVLYRHRSNIVRLIKGEESKISFKKKK